MTALLHIAHFALPLLGAPLMTAAQEPGIPTVGVVDALGPADGQLRRELSQGLRELGYVEGQNIMFETRFAAGSHQRAAELARELVHLKVDVLVINSTVGARAAKSETTTIPIVVAGSVDPVGSGLVETLARPGGNVTGLALMSPELGVKRLELLKEAVSVSRVLVLWNPGNPAQAAVLKEIERAAPSLRLRVQPLAVPGPEALERALSRPSPNRTDGLLVFDDALFVERRAYVVAQAAKLKLPAIYGFKSFVEAGGLMCYGLSTPHLFRRSAIYVAKILKGAKPADLPVEQPTRFELVINLKTAKALGLTIPQSVLVRADQVIK